MKALNKEDRKRMAADREEMLGEESCEYEERQDLIAQIDLLLDFSIRVGFDGNNVVRL